MEGEPIVLRDDPPVFTVNLGAGVRTAIEAELRAVQRQMGRDYEAGGWLFTRRRPQRSDDFTVSISRATHAGASTHGHYSLELQPALEAFPDFKNLGFVGCWHTHPHSRSSRPSAADMRAWAGWLDKFLFRAYLGLIVTPDPEGLTGWNYPRIAGWVMRREGSPSKLVCEPARVVE